MDDFLKDVGKWWDELSTEDQAFITQSVGTTIGQFVLYKILRKLEAPKWAAYGISLTAAHAQLAPARHAYEQRKRVRNATSSRG
jgi:hypothetical protein